MKREVKERLRELVAEYEETGHPDAIADIVRVLKEKVLRVKPEEKPMAVNVASPKMINLQDVRVTIQAPASWPKDRQEKAYDLLDQVDVYAAIHQALTEQFKRYGLLQNVTIDIVDL